MTDAPTIDELYLSANHTSNLRIVADRGGAGDVVVSAGWSRSRVGVALMRLHGEWDGAAKRPGMSDADILILRGQLKSLSAVLEQMTVVMHKMRIETPERKVGKIVGHWLSPLCPTCTGKQFELIPGTPIKSTRRCKTCHGEGVVPTPLGQNGRRVQTWMDEAVDAGRNSIKHRLHGRK